MPADGHRPHGLSQRRGLETFGPATGLNEGLAVSVSLDLETAGLPCLHEGRGLCAGREGPRWHQQAFCSQPGGWPWANPSTRSGLSFLDG